MVPEIQVMDEAPSPGQGTFLFLLLESEGVISGFSALGRRGKPAEAVADEATDQLIDYVDSGESVDPHLSDQLVPFLGLATGKSAFTVSRITRHLMTNIWVVRQFLDIRIDVSGREGETGKVEIHP
jgi:RNA 3'-terminal phosphate cyclase